MKKFAGDIIILHMCTKNHNIWCMVPKICSETDIIFCHFGRFFALLPIPCHPPPPLSPSPPPTLMIPKIKWKKMKKMPGDIILLYIHVQGFMQPNFVTTVFNIRLCWSTHHGWGKGNFCKIQTSKTATSLFFFSEMLILWYYLSNFVFATHA